MNISLWLLLMIFDWSMWMVELLLLFRIGIRDNPVILKLLGFILIFIWMDLLLSIHYF